MFLRLMLLMPLMRQFMLLEELDLHPSDHDLALEQVRAVASDVSVFMTLIPDWDQFGTVRPRRRWNWLPIRRRRVRIGWLGLYNPLWLADDGTILREYETILGNSYFMEAEIHLRDTEGLQRIEDALRHYPQRLRLSNPLST